MDVAFQSLPLRVLPGDQIPPGRAQLGAATLQVRQLLFEFGAQPGDPQNQAGLGGQAREQSLLDGRQLLSVPQHDGQCPE